MGPGHALCLRVKAVNELTRTVAESCPDHLKIVIEGQHAQLMACVGKRVVSAETTSELLKLLEAGPWDEHQRSKLADAAINGLANRKGAAGGASNMKVMQNWEHMAN